MKCGVMLLIAALTCSGCTSLALQRQSNSQAATATDLRYQEVLDNLAMIAEDPYALPAYSSIFAGTAEITDTASITSTTTLGPTMPAQSIASPFTRVVLGNWTLDPINAPEKLEAIRCACRWVIYGRESACNDCVGLLETPENAPCPGRHFGVADRLERLPRGWLCVGHLHDVPIKCCYKAHCGDKWVWVMPDNVQSLADFNLILQDIARVDINSPTLQYIRPVPSDFLFPTLDRDKPEKDRLPCNQRGCRDDTGDKVRASVIAEVSVDPCYWLMPDVPYYRWRTENVGSDPNLRSLINAAGLH
jgi:hypothetical protein